MRTATTTENGTSIVKDDKTQVAEDLLYEFRNTGLCTSEPYFKKAHRWESAFPSISISLEEKCLFDRKHKVVICGDFCTSPRVEGTHWHNESSDPHPDKEEVQEKLATERERSEMGTSVVCSLSLKPYGFTTDKAAAVRGVPSLSRQPTAFKVMASGVKKIKTDTPYGGYELDWCYPCYS